MRSKPIKLLSVFFFVFMLHLFSFANEFKMFNDMIAQSKNQIKKMNFPDVSLDKSFSEYLNENKSQISIDSINKYCLAQARIYSNKVESHVQISNLYSNFERRCSSMMTFSSRINKENIEPELITILTESQLKSGYLEVITNPFLSKLQNLEKIENAYQSSIFGFMGIQMHKSIFLEQLLILTAVLISAAVLVLKSI
jgi:hypothetical protein